MAACCLGPSDYEIVARRENLRDYGPMAVVTAGALARAGLLDGRPAATNHAAFGFVTTFGPRVLWDNVSRWVDVPLPLPPAAEAELKQHEGQIAALKERIKAAKDAIYALRRKPEARAEAKAVVQKHGSRKRTADWKHEGAKADQLKLAL